MEMDESLYGTHGDGHRNSEYCIYCYEDGIFKSSSMAEQIAINTSEERLEAFTKPYGQSIGRGEMTEWLRSYLPTLKRWMDTEKQASWILDRCGYVTLSTIGKDGFPHPVAIDVISHDGIREIWMTTYSSSSKARNIRENPKSGISFVHEADSVSLIGTAEIITDHDILSRFWEERFRHYYPDGQADKGYCLIRFTSSKAVCWIDGIRSTIESSLDRACCQDFS